MRLFAAGAADADANAGEAEEKQDKDIYKILAHVVPHLRDLREIH